MNAEADELSMDRRLKNVFSGRKLGEACLVKTVKSAFYLEINFV